MILANVDAQWGEMAIQGTMLCVAAVLAAAVLYAVVRNGAIVRAIKLGQVLILGCLSLASWQLLTGLLDDNFSLAYVSMHSEKALAWGYKVAAFWAGQEGSILLWAWLLAIMGVLMAIRLRKSEEAFTVIALATMTAATGFFTLVMMCAANPFKLAAPGQAMGMGLNPALQNLAMVFHPPMLFLGYAGFTAPFAYMVAGLLTGRTKHEDAKGTKTHEEISPRRHGDTERGISDLRFEISDVKGAGGLGGEAWLGLARPWMVYSWITLTVGILLGAQWAYMELGWGGYWAWDPVENASLLPWLTGTALLHSAILQQRRGMFKRWTAYLTAASFFLCVLGTYLTRSGVIESVHAFEQSTIGYYFLAFLGVIFVGSLVLIVLAARRRRLDSAHKLEALISREGTFMMANVLLVIMTVTVTVGTLYPLISHYVATGINQVAAVLHMAWRLNEAPVTVNQPFYNSVVLPMALVLAAIMATGPVLGSGAGALERASQKFGGMLIAGAATAALVLMLGYANLWALAVAVVVGAVVGGVAIDVYMSLRSGQGVVKALTARHRHWGAQLAHLGLAAIVAGIAGSSLFQQTKVMVLHNPASEETASKKERSIGGYVMTLANMKDERRGNYTAAVATVTLAGPDGRKLTLRPELRRYDSDPENLETVVALRPGVFSDVYMTLKAADPSSVTISTLVNPLVNWIWAGGILMTLGGLMCLIPGRVVSGQVPVVSDEGETREQKQDDGMGAGALAAGRGKNKRERKRALAFEQSVITAGRRL